MVPSISKCKRQQRALTKYLCRLIVLALLMPNLHSTNRHNYGKVHCEMLTVDGMHSSNAPRCSCDKTDLHMFCVQKRDRTRASLFVPYNVQKEVCGTGVLRCQFLLKPPPQISSGTSYGSTCTTKTITRHTIVYCLLYLAPQWCLSSLSRRYICLHSLQYLYYSRSCH